MPVGDVGQECEDEAGALGQVRVQGRGSEARGVRVSESTAAIEGRGPRDDGYWCCACGVWETDENGLETCPVSRAQMQALTPQAKGLSHPGRPRCTTGR